MYHMKLEDGHVLCGVVLDKKKSLKLIQSVFF